MIYSHTHTHVHACMRTHTHRATTQLYIYIATVATYITASVDFITILYIVISVTINGKILDDHVHSHFIH